MKPTRAERKSGKCANFMLYEVVEIPKEILDYFPSANSAKGIVWGVKNNIIRVTEGDYIVGTPHPSSDYAQYKEGDKKE